MENLQEPWSKEEWDAYVQCVLAQGDDVSVHQVVLPALQWEKHPFDPAHPVLPELDTDPVRPLNITN